MSAAQPPFTAIVTQDGVTWFAIYDYGHRPEGLREGTGCFITFRSTNADGTLGDWVMLNGGLIDRTAGKEQGDLDMLIRVNGQVNGMALVGDMTAFGGPPAALEPTQDALFNLGNAGSRWKDLFLAGMLNVTTIGKQISINGVDQWCDCIAVNTQQGVRYIPVFAALAQPADSAVADNMVAGDVVD